jgi:hypothetical protein
VLVAIFVMGIGVMSLLVLFPLGLQNVKWALDNEQVARAASSGQTMAEVAHLRIDEGPLTQNHPVVTTNAQSLRNDDYYRPQSNNQTMPWWQVQQQGALVAARLGRPAFLLESPTPGTVPSVWTFARDLVPAGATVTALPSATTRRVLPPVFVDPIVAANFIGLGLPFHVGATNPLALPLGARSPFANHASPTTVPAVLRPSASLGLPRMGLSHHIYDNGSLAMRLENDTTLRDEIVFGPDGQPAAGVVNNRRFSWAYLCRWPDYNDPEVCDVTLVTFNTRPMGQGALTNSPPGETTYFTPSTAPSLAAGLEPAAANFGRIFRKGFATAVIPLGNAPQPSVIRSGDWILDNTFILPSFNEALPNRGETAPFLDEFNPATIYRYPAGTNTALHPGLAGGHFYKVVDISGVRAAGGQFFQVVTLDRAAKSDGFVVTAFSGLSDVIEKGVGRMPSH